MLGLWQKANRSLGVIKRNLSKCPENVKEQAYLTLVRPQLEYVDVAHGIRTFKNRKKKKLRVRRDDRHVFSKKLI